ncbi:SusD/RagB family nutrient-binding outer membrane lipoprotein [Desertivirga arenae]|uniref:SusD/RagB family nutrient-binding outer membrane lipoprotein n=1 Tax=Desertivirga arenae TaxID=2810309 RepID=UPI001A9680A9|nr:SusD/RagB family nutrient-binding outer membrane lipoprotein [Pedobacter sp. SYSU D00823]
MKKVIYSFITLLLIVSAGCKKDFFDINKNPNAPTEDVLTPDLILPNVLHQTARKMATSYDFAAHWTGYWARSGSFGPSNPLESYDINTNYETNEWVNESTANYNPAVSWYNIMMDADVMQRKAEASGQTFYVGIAKVIKSIGFMYLVDSYNNVPYTEAFQGTKFITPKYDNGQDIYRDLLVQLDDAAKIFASVDMNANAGITTADIMFNGNALKWRKLANTQRLKLLIHQSEVFGATPPTAEIAKITADGSGFLGAGETASVNPGYAKNEFQQNPFWDTYKKTFSGSTSDDFNRANNYVLNKLKANDDIRYQYYFSAASTPVGGLTYRGYNFGFVDPDPNQPKAANSSDVAGPGLVKGPEQALWLFTSVESMFLQAEAVQRGWLPGNARTAYENAVRESFSWLGVTNATATANTYLAGAGAYQSNVQFIVMQKYLSLVGINNFEAWVDYRRLGVPSDLPLSQSPSRVGGVPVRLLYPQDEYNNNAANVGAQGEISAQTSKVFWDK